MKNSLLLTLTSLLLIQSCDEANVVPQEQEESVPHSGSCVVLETTPRGFKLPEGVSGAWGYKNKVWRKKTLRVEFFGKSTAHQRAQATKYLKFVDDLCGVEFKVGKFSRSDIRIGFTPNSGHWSYLGTDCSTIPERQQTMNLGLNHYSSDTEWRRVAVHEILHALGFGHSQQNPNQRIPWDEEKVIAHYKATQGWSERETRHQVLNGSKPYGSFNNGYDKNSIMHYPVENFLTVGDYEVGWNTSPSTRDIAMLRKLYGKN